jgi:hypothetical protein
MTRARGLHPLKIDLYCGEDDPVLCALEARLDEPLAKRGRELSSSTGRTFIRLMSRRADAYTS